MSEVSDFKIKVKNDFDSISIGTHLDKRIWIRLMVLWLNMTNAQTREYLNAFRTYAKSTIFEVQHDDQRGKGLQTFIFSFELLVCLYLFLRIHSKNELHAMYQGILSPMQWNEMIVNMYNFCHTILLARQHVRDGTRTTAELQISDTFEAVVENQSEMSCLIPKKSKNVSLEYNTTTNMSYTMKSNIILEKMKQQEVKYLGPIEPPAPEPVPKPDLAKDAIVSIEKVSEEEKRKQDLISTMKKISTATDIHHPVQEKLELQDDIDKADFLLYNAILPNKPATEATFNGYDIVNMNVLK